MAFNLKAVMAVKFAGAIVIHCGVHASCGWRQFVCYVYSGYMSYKHARMIDRDAAKIIVSMGQLESPHFFEIRSVELSRAKCLSHFRGFFMRNCDKHLAREKCCRNARSAKKHANLYQSSCRCMQSRSIYELLMHIYE